MSPEMRNAHPIALVTLALMFLCAPFLLQTVAQEPQTPSAASTTAPAPSTPLVELVRSLAWPVSALVMAFAFRRPIAAFVTALGTRVTKLSVFKVELELVPATSATSTPLLDDIHTATTSAPISDSSRMMLEQVQSGTLADYATIDIGTGDEWLTSRLFIAATMLERMRGLQVMAHLPALFFVHPVPQIRAEDVDDPVVQHHRVLRIEIERPVDPVGRVPLLLLALGIELQQGFARLVVFPSKIGLGIAVELPLGLLDREHIAVGRRHRVSPGSCYLQRYGAPKKRIL